jgi:hypothetical protein
LRGPATPAREDALARLHPLRLRAQQFALSRQPDQLSGLGTADIDGLAVRAADDALMSNLRTLDDYRGASRFTTWASKFAVHEAGVKGRRARRKSASPWANRPTTKSREHREHNRLRWRRLGAGASRRDRRAFARRATGRTPDPRLRAADATADRC